MSKEKSNQRFHIRSAFLGGLVAAMIVSALPAVAAQVGDALSLGESNRVNAQTILRGRAISNLTIISDARGDTNGTALDLRVRAGNPPMKVNSSDLVEGLNADLLDGKQSTDFVGAGQVLFASVTSAGELYGSGNAVSAERIATGDYEVVFDRSTVGCAGTATSGWSDDGAGTNNFGTTFGVFMGTTWDPDPNTVRVFIWRPSLSAQQDTSFHLVIVCPAE
jgi:hypothetical protein